MESLTVSLIQPALHWNNPVANHTMFADFIQPLRGKTDLIILPETFTTGFSISTDLAETMEGETISWMRTQAQESGAVIVGSLVIMEGEKYYNRLIYMQHDGLYQYYDKRHLFSISNEATLLTAGTRLLTITLKGWRIRGLICYDLRFPVWSRNGISKDGIADYDLLLYIANWPERRAAAWRSLLPARAIENQCYTIGVNRIGEDGNGITHIGESAIIDPLGKVLFTYPNNPIVHTQTLASTVLDEVRMSLPFLLDGDVFTLHS